jgi:hypothetical protein
LVEVVETFRDHHPDLEDLVDVVVVDQVEEIHQHLAEEAPLKLIMVEVDTTEKLVELARELPSIVVVVAVAAVELVKMVRTLEMVMVESECGFHQIIDTHLISMF